jgi:AcrR family transcriptional regulator
MTTVIKDGARRERKKAASRARIVQCAVELFAQRGIEAVTVEEIAAAADLGKGTIYNYFRTKEDIVVAFMADFEEQVQARVRELELSERPVQEILLEFVRIQASMKARHHAFVRVFFAQMFLNTETFLPYMARIHAMTMPPLQNVLSALQKRGELRKDVDVVEIAGAFTNLHFGLAALWTIEGPPFRHATEAARSSIKLFCEGPEAKRR